MQGSLSNIIVTEERPFLKVPFETVNKTFRQSQKAVEKEIGVLDKAVQEIGKKKQVSKDDASKYLDKMVQRLRGVKRKLDETDVAEEEQLMVCKKRIEHLESFPQIPSASASDQVVQQYKLEKMKWNRIRLNRILVDYLLRAGYYDAAILLSEKANIKDFVDVDIFIKSSKVVEGLKQKNCTDALSWCADNKSKLKKLKSNLEFDLRLQEFIELVRLDKKHDAISYARKNLSPLIEDCEDKEQSELTMTMIRQAMATLAFGKDTKVSPYKDLFDTGRWERLIDEFKHSNFLLYSLTTKPLLNISLQAGLSALKTPFAYQPDHFNINDPLCQAPFQQLSEGLPFSFHIHSKLVCRISGNLMDDKNPPMVLPNGNVYSLAALEEMAKKSADKQTINDPRTGQTYKLQQLKKAIII